jgi:hypothetical protein
MSSLWSSSYMFICCCGGIPTISTRLQMVYIFIDALCNYITCIMRSSWCYWSAVDCDDRATVVEVGWRRLPSLPRGNFHSVSSTKFFCAFPISSPAITHPSPSQAPWFDHPNQERSQWPRGLRRELSRQLKYWGRGFESRSRHRCLCRFLLFVLSCVQVQALRRARSLLNESNRLL